MTKPIEDMTKAELLDEVRRLTGAPSPVPSIDLLDCPCCGGKAECEKEPSGIEWLVRCTVCDLNTPFQDAETAVRQWNTRQSNERSHGSDD